MTNEMKVDVLSVMDDQIGVIYPSRSPEEAAWHKRVVEARAAVAELIDRAAEAERQLSAIIEDGFDVSHCSSHRLKKLRAAIARVGGA